MATIEQLRSLVSDVPAVLALVGEHAIVRARRAFRDQKAPDGTPWPQRYPNQGADFLNVAGAIEDLRTGPRIKKRRYDRRPAGRDTGDLMSRLTYEVRGGELLAGANVPYAERFHEGGQSTQSIDSIVRQNLAKLLRSKRRKRKRERKRAREFGLDASGLTGRTLEERRLGPLFSTREWTTTSPPRKFLGLTDQDVQDLTVSMHRAAERR